MKNYPKNKKSQRSANKVKKKRIVSSEVSDMDFSKNLEASHEKQETKLEGRDYLKSSLTDLFDTPLNSIGDNRRRPRTELL